jgi:UDP-N-acetylmuramoyl-tripeptide--D-alanyl-D-alanine ligase
MGGQLSGDAGGAVWSGAAIDSRAVRGGELFFALPGEHTDGHLFVAAALAAGAAAVVVHGEVEAPPDSPLVRVSDVLRALHALTRHVRQGSEEAPPVPRRLAAITGSTGKTTTKELAAAMLSRRFRTARNEGNLNNLYGFPLSLLNAPDDTEWMVAEMGMSAAGELSQLSALARPDAVLYTNVRPVHLEFFASLRDIAEAKAELLEGLVAGGLVVANADDPEVRRFVERFAATRAAGGGVQVVWYGRSEDAAVRAVGVGPAGGGDPGSRFVLEVGSERGVEEREIHLPLHGGYNVDNALAAAAFAWALGVDLADIAAAAEEAAPTTGRGVVHPLAGGVTVIDDSYNSNPEALVLALASAAALAGGRRWAVLGDMLELGPDGARFHREAGRQAARLGFAPLVGVGELARELVAGAEEEGAPAHWFATAAEAAEFAAGEAADGDLVLVKGSRGVGLDRVVERLRAERAPGDGGAG